MPAISRVGDNNNAGGAIIGGASAVFINGKPAGQVGNTLSSHAPYGHPHPPHQSATVTSGSSTVIIEGKQAAKVGSSNSCGHSMVEGSPDVNVA
jgi:uncharacterized Zn-binding protein involved in type VI secretion